MAVARNGDAWITWAGGGRAGRAARHNPRVRSHAHDRRGRVVRGVAASVAALLAGALLPAAATAAAGDPVVVREGRDARAAGAPDLTRVQLGLAADGRLRAALTLADAWTASTLVARPDAEQPAPPGSLCLRLWTRGATTGVPADHLVCLTAGGDGENLRGSVLREGDDGLLRRVGPATVARSSARTATLRFSQSAVGRPRRVRFAGEATRAGCPRTSCVDTAPDAPQTATLVLRGAP
jgi:hypothetical protein